MYIYTFVSWRTETSKEPGVLCTPEKVEVLLIVEHLQNEETF